MADWDFEGSLVEAIPHLRAFARSFTSDASHADDLVQETLIRAWNSRASFVKGTNFRAWLFTILRNTYFSSLRKLKHEVPDPDLKHTSVLETRPEQYGHVDLADIADLMARLPQDQREALLLVGAAGFTYEEAAEISNCAVGTIKSRVARARSRLEQLIERSEMDTTGGGGSDK